MKARLPTAEERKLWRAVNQHTHCFRHYDALPEPHEAATDEPVATEPPPAVATPPYGARDARLKGSIPPLPLLPTREARRTFQAFPVDAVLDLHGLNKLDARERVQHFLYHQYHAHHRHVLIITGKGKGGEAGVLRAGLPDWLAEMPLRAMISAIAHARPEKGGTGVTHVLLKRA